MFNYLFFRHYVGMKKITESFGGAVEFFLILICILIVLSIVGNSNPYKREKGSDDLPPDFFKDWYKNNK
jgi:hypothetical protein